MSDIMRALEIPTNPTYEPGEVRGKQYVNPVHLNNKLIQATNTHGTVIDLLVGAQRKIVGLKAKLADTEASIEDLEQQMLLELPPPPSDRKSNKLVEAYLVAVAHKLGYDSTYASMKEIVRKLRREIAEAEIEKDECKLQLDHIKLLCENGKTHLAWVKQEQANARANL